VLEILQAVTEYFQKHGILISGMGGRFLRLVTHLDLSEHHVKKAINAINSMPAAFHDAP
jgi:hypothetical protein